MTWGWKGASWRGRGARGQGAGSLWELGDRREPKDRAPGPPEEELAGGLSPAHQDGARKPGLAGAVPPYGLQVMKVKLQPPSGTELPAFNPIVHPSAITQVLLLANPQKVRGLAVIAHRRGGGAASSLPLTLPSSLPQEKVRLRYKLLFTMGDQTYNEMGDVDQFPPPETWGSL